MRFFFIALVCCGCSAASSPAAAKVVADEVEFVSDEVEEYFGGHPCHECPIHCPKL